MMTEDEAKQKWCPQYREWEGDNRPRAWDGKERSSDLKTIHTTAMCIGSACMAWRWTNETQTRGYCGIAGHQK